MTSGPGTAPDSLSQPDDTPEGAPKLSIVVVSHNTRDELARCLAATPEGDHERIVVDSGSSDGSRDLVRAIPSIRLIELPNVGFGAAANAGIRLARGEYVLVLNADAHPLPGALDRLTAVADAHPEAAIIAPRLWRPDGSVQRSVFSSPRGPVALAGWALAPHAVSGAYGLLQGAVAAVGRRSAGVAVDSLREITGQEYVQGAAILLRRKALRALGGFDQRFFMFCEEVDLCYRFRDAGWTVLWTPAADFTHEGGAAVRQYPGDMHFELMRAHLLLLTKYRGEAVAGRARRFLVWALRVRALTHRGLGRRRYAYAA